MLTYGKWEGNAKTKTVRPHLPGLVSNLPCQDIIFCCVLLGSLKWYTVTEGHLEV